MLIFPFTQTLYAAAGQPSAGSEPNFIVQLVPFLLIAVIFYFLIIRPQQKKAKQHKKMISEIKRGDKVMLSSGVFGRVSKTFPDKNFLLVEIAENVSVKVLQDHISQVGEFGSDSQNAKLKAGKDKGAKAIESSTESDEGEQPQPKSSGRRPRRGGRGGQRKPLGDKPAANDKADGDSPKVANQKPESAENSDSKKS